MKTILIQKTVPIPATVTVTVKARKVHVTGPRGELCRSFAHSAVDIAVQRDADGHSVVRVALWHGTRKLCARVNTIAAHVRNMITGVTRGYCYKMRLVYAHFPIDVSLVKQKDNMRVEIRNFYGMKERRVEMREGVAVVRSEAVKDELVLEGNDLEAVAQSAASIQQSVKVRGKDIRKFLDGIYVSHKGLATQEE